MELTEREADMISRYREMAENIELAPDIGISDEIEFHLHHIARYISRIKGFSSLQKKPIEEYRDTDLGSCLISSVIVIDEVMKKEFGEKWAAFSDSVEGFRNQDRSARIEEIESTFMELCNGRNYNPGPI